MYEIDENQNSMRLILYYNWQIIRIGAPLGK